MKNIEPIKTFNLFKNIPPQKIIQNFQAIMNDNNVVIFVVKVIILSCY